MAGFRFTAQEARTLAGIKKESFERTLSVIRQMVDVIVREASIKGGDSVTFDVPEMVWGRDSFDRHAMGKALAEQLFNDNFDVTGTTAKLNISWKTESEPERPIKGMSFSARTAMPSSAVATRGLKKKKVERHVNLSYF